MYHLALKMLLGDRAKYVMLISGPTFATLLMAQQCSVFFGLMLWTTGSLRNMRPPIWVVDPKVSQLNEVELMRDTDVSKVKTSDPLIQLDNREAAARLTNGSIHGRSRSSLNSTGLRVLCM